MHKFFNNCNNLEQAKKLYRELAMENHPDHGGDLELMKQINIEFENILKFLSNRNSNDKYDSPSYDTETLANALSAIIHIQKINIEIIGNWIWVTGDTFRHKTIFAEAGFKWSKSKKSWYYSGTELKQSRGNYSMEKLREKWGTKNIKTSKIHALA